MALKFTRFCLNLIFIISSLLLLIPAWDVHALSGMIGVSQLPSLQVFAQQVSNGQAGELRGVYVPGILASPIVQQPAGMRDFVSPWQNVLTQFSMATRLGSTGLLAHNYLAGESFSLLQAGQEIYLIDGAENISTFTVTQILRYQAVPTGDKSTSFLDLQTQKPITASALFKQMYNRPGQVIFQTCIQMGNDSNWGRLFVIAEPFPQ